MSYCRILYCLIELKKIILANHYAEIIKKKFSKEMIASKFQEQLDRLDKLNKDKRHRLESIELSYLICNFFKLLEGRIPQEILSNVKPILHLKDSLYEQLINEFHLFMMNNPLIIGLTQKDSFNFNGLLI